jgi:hypothetical protein
MIFGKGYLVAGYERVFRNNQSVSFNIGKFYLPKFVDIEMNSFELESGSDAHGFTFATDYRFYLKKENKYRAPRGLYLGPYYSFNNLSRDNTWTYENDPANIIETTNKVNINLIGAQMGYQFVIKERFTIDFIFLGPGRWFYSVKTTIHTNLTSEEEEVLFEEINNMLAEKLPGSEFLIEPGEKFKNGSMTTSSSGFRYLMHLGFRF